MAITSQKTFADLTRDTEKGFWIISNSEPHVSIKIKSVFTKIAVYASEFKFKDNLENAFELTWFLNRYPMRLSDSDKKYLKKQQKKYIELQSELNKITLPDYIPTSTFSIKEGQLARAYQITGRELILHAQRILIGDDTGLGKTATAIFALLESISRPAVVVMQTHMPTQWKEQIEKFSEMNVHIINTTKVYTLPPADIYLISYSKIAKWSDILSSGLIKSVVFDECQELRHSESDKYRAAMRISTSVNIAVGLSATPIYNYADEIFNIIDVIKEGSLGTKDGFCREWSAAGYSSGKKLRIKDPEALGSYLREQYLFLRRTRKEVNRDLPQVNTIIHTIGYDSATAKNAEQIATMLARKTTTASFVERGQAARELDIFLRQQTGIAKAKEVAEYVRILLENNEPVILAGWHREVYEIWKKELSEFNPGFYTGSESPKQKEQSKQDFINGKTNLFVISLRSGVGLDGLQIRNPIVVFGELDWSPQVHHQVISRADRDGRPIEDEHGNPIHITAVYLVTEYGSDPSIIELNGIKSSISKSIIDPFDESAPQFSDESRLVKLAKKYLEQKN